MNEIAVKEPPSVIADMAARYGMDKRAFEATIRETCIPTTEKAKVTNEQFVAFLLVAKEYKLNPLTKEVYAFPTRSGGIQPIVSIDGWCNIINSHDQLDGIEFDDIKDANGALTAIACKIHRKDRQHPTIAIEYMSECKRPTEPWKQWPARMLRHKALIQAARYAFGFSGIVDPDEGERIAMVDVTPPVKSLFKNSTLRKTWFEHVAAAIEGAVDAEELEMIMEGYKDKIAEMVSNGHEHDVLTVEELERRSKTALQKLEAKSQVESGFGQGFANTPVSDSVEEVVQDTVLEPSSVGKTMFSKKHEATA